MWKLHQMDRTTENHNTSYSVPAGHPLISCLLFSFSCKQRERMQQKQLHRLTVKACANLKQRHKRPQELWIYMWYILCLFLVSHRYVWCRIFRFFTYMSYWLQLCLFSQGPERRKEMEFLSSTSPWAFYNHSKNHLASRRWILTLRLFSFTAQACRGKGFATIQLLGQNTAIVLLIAHPLLFVGEKILRGHNVPQLLL